MKCIQKAKLLKDQCQVVIKKIPQKLIDVYLFKLSEELLQAEVQANHIGECVLTPPTPSSAYILSSVILVKG